jgi:hypothetical protein
LSCGHLFQTSVKIKRNKPNKRKDAVCAELRACDDIKVPESLHLDIPDSLDEM